MVSVCMYFQVHQPHRLKRYGMFEIGEHSDYYDDTLNAEIARKVARKSYLPANAVMQELIDRFGGKFRISYSITGTALEQFERFAPEVLESFKRLAATGHVEFLAETYYHSLAYLYSKEEFDEQVRMHTKRIQDLFGQTPRVFRHTELIFNNEVAQRVEAMGYAGILAEGADHLLGWRSPNFVYRPAATKRIKVLLKNYKLSDDIAFRFSNKEWKEHPLTVDKYVQWLNATNGNGEVVNLFMDYETFGEHQWEDTGIFEFLRHLPEAVLRHPDNDFVTVSEAVDRYEARGVYDAHNFISWADVERDLSAWLGNRLQHSAIEALYGLEKEVKESGDENIIRDWRGLTTSDHFYYMCTKWFADGDVHKYFNAYDSPYEGFIAFMNVLQDLQLRLSRKEEVGMIKR